MARAVGPCHAAGLCSALSIHYSHKNLTKWVEFLEPCLQTGKQRPQEVGRQLQCVDQAGGRLRSLRRLFWLKEEQKGFGATRVSVGYT